MKYSIVIPTMTLRLVKTCAESIVKCSDISDMDIIIVANGMVPEDKNNLINFVEKIEKENNKKDLFKILWNNEPLGAVKALNMGIDFAVKKSESEYIMLFNDDCVILQSEKNFVIDELTKPFNDLKVGATGPMKIWPQLGEFKLNFTKERMENGFLIFFCVMIPRKIFLELGFLDDTLQCGVDIDFCMRLFDKGYKIVEVDSSEKRYEGGYRISSFPLFHAAEATVHKFYGNDKWRSILEKDSKELNKRYGYVEDNENKKINNLPDGWFGEIDIKIYKDLVSKIPDNGKMLEIGTWKGRSLCSIADIIKEKNISVWAIDTFEGTSSTPMEVEAHKEAKTIDIEKLFKENIKSFDIENNINVIRGNSQNNDVVSKFEDEFFDLIFIDGDHMALRGDIDLWYPKLKYDRICAGHDVKWPVVKSVLFDVFQDDWIEEFNIWTKLKTKYVDGKKRTRANVTAYISTKNRYYTTLPMAIAGVVGQTVKPKELILLDDGEQKDLRNDPVYQCLFKMLDEVGIGWCVIFGSKRGQVPNHQKMLNDAKCNLIWRIDDDNFPEANVLETLLDKISSDEKIGAVASRSVIPGNVAYKRDASSKIDDLNIKPNLQWTKFSGWEEADHLHNSFLYRKQAGKHGYHLGLSPAGHREETMFTYGMKLNGWKLFVNGEVITWHLRQPQGGIRTYKDESMWRHDEDVFRKWMQSQNEKLPEDSLMVVLDCGLGDHIVFASLMPEIKTKYKHIIIASCYTDVFKDEPVTQISIAEAVARLGNIEQYNIYKWMLVNNWKTSIKDAFRRMYNI